MHSSYSDCMRSRGERERAREKKVIERNNVIPLLNVPCILAITCSHCRHTDLSLDQWVAVLRCSDLQRVKGPLT